jgi:hypothetical protein
MGRRLFRKPTSELEEIEKPVKVRQDEAGMFHPEWARYSKQTELDQDQLKELYDAQPTDSDRMIQRKLTEAREASKAGDFQKADQISEEIMEASRLIEKFKKGER